MSTNWGLEIKALAYEIHARAGAIIEGIEKLIGPAEEAPEAPPVVPRALLQIGTAQAKKGAQAVVGLWLTCHEPIAGMWFNVRHSPRLEFVSATSKVKSRAFRVEKQTHHFRGLLMFSTDLEGGSAVPGQGLVILEPETLVLEATYRVPDDATPGQRYVVQAGFSGSATPGATNVAWRTLLLNWGQGITEGGGIEPLVEDGYIEVVA